MSPPHLSQNQLRQIQLIAERHGPQQFEHAVLNPLQRLSASSDLLLALSDPLVSLKVLLGHYSFQRRPKDRADYSRASIRAVERLGPAALNPDLLWIEFAQLLELRQLRLLPDQNQPLVTDLSCLAQNLAPLSIHSWIIQLIEQTNQLEAAALAINDIRGLGPKTAAQILADTITLFSLELHVRPAHRIYAQPVTPWLRRIAPLLFPEPHLSSAPDWVIAGKTLRYTRLAGVSHTLFTHGCTHFGAQIVRDESRLADALNGLAPAESIAHWPSEDRPEST